MGLRGLCLTPCRVWSAVGYHSPGVRISYGERPAHHPTFARAGGGEDRFTDQEPYPSHTYWPIDNLCGVHNLLFMRTNFDLPMCAFVDILGQGTHWLNLA